MGALSVASADAVAATVTIDSGGPAPARLIYVADPGERNRLQVDRRPLEDLVTVRDPGAVVSSPPDVCTQPDPHTAHCRSRPDRFGHPTSLFSLTVDLADLDDVLTFGDVGPGGLPVVASGGAGDDHLIGTVGGEELDGGPGDDTIRGGRNADVLAGGGGRDELYGQEDSDQLTDGDGDADAGSDVLDGGDGEDLVSYAQRSGSVVVDLGDPGRDGAPGEGDVVRDVEGVLGGDGDDRLVGENRSRLAPYGRFGSVLDGGAGHDRLIGRRGRDVLAPGADGARVSCGPGADVLAEEHFLWRVRRRARIDRRTRVDRDCERLQLWSFRLQPMLELNPTRRGFRVSCAPTGEDLEYIERCAPRVRLVRQRELLAAARKREGNWDDALARWRFTARGRDLLARRTVWATVRTSGANFPRREWTVRVSAETPARRAREVSFAPYQGSPP